MPSLKPNGKRLNGKGSGWLPRWRRLAIYLRDQFTCAYCGRNLHGANPREVTLDHLVPQCKGGTHHESNLVTACASCNFRRQDRPWKAWVQEVNPALADVLVARVNRLRRRVLNAGLAKDIIAGRQTTTGITR